LIRTVPSKGRSDNASDYRRAFVERAHQLILMAYDRLTPTSYRVSHEMVITEALVQAICEIFDDPRSEEWVDFFAAYDEAPEKDRNRKGKHRRRLDIKIVSSERRPRQIFSFEAKRLDRSHSVGAYLGKDGLGLFLEGGYARDVEDGGMLGYVQFGERAGWAAKISQALVASPRRYAALPDGCWKKWPVIKGLDHCYRSRHMRSSLRREIDLYHTLLAFK
jgi:hypothetical protein